MDGEKREKILSFRVTLTEYQMIRKKYERERTKGQTLTDWILSRFDLESEDLVGKKAEILEQINAIKKIEKTLTDFYIQNEE